MVRMISRKTFVAGVTSWLTMLAASPAPGAGPVVGWGAGAPQPRPGLVASAIAAGGFHACAIEAGSAAVACWGDDSYGQATPPASVDGTTGTASAIAVGGYFPLTSNSSFTRR